MTVILNFLIIDIVFTILLFERELVNILIVVFIVCKKKKKINYRYIDKKINLIKNSMKIL